MAETPCSRLARFAALAGLLISALVLLAVVVHATDPPSPPDASDAVQNLRLDRIERDVAEQHAWAVIQMDKIRDEHAALTKLLIGNLFALSASLVTYILVHWAPARRGNH